MIRLLGRKYSLATGIQRPRLAMSYFMLSFTYKQHTILHLLIYVPRGTTAQLENSLFRRDCIPQQRNSVVFPYPSLRKSLSEKSISLFSNYYRIWHRRARKCEIKTKHPSNFNLFSAKCSYLWFIDEPLKNYLFFCRKGTLKGPNLVGMKFIFFTYFVLWISRVDSFW